MWWYSHGMRRTSNLMNHPEFFLKTFYSLCSSRCLAGKHQPSRCVLSSLGAFALSRKAPFIFLFVHLSAYINSAPIGRILVKFMSNTFVKICWSNADLIQTNSMEQSPSWEANRTSASQDIARILWNPEFHHRIYKSPPLKSDHFTKTQGFWQCWGQHKSDIKSMS